MQIPIPPGSGAPRVEWVRDANQRALAAKAGDGLLRPGKTTNLPDGEVFTCPYDVNVGDIRLPHSSGGGDGPECPDGAEQVIYL